MTYWTSSKRRVVSLLLASQFAYSPLSAENSGLFLVKILRISIYVFSGNSIFDSLDPSFLPHFVPFHSRQVATLFHSHFRSLLDGMSAIFRCAVLKFIRGDS